MVEKGGARGRLGDWMATGEKVARAEAARGGMLGGSRRLNQECSLGGKEHSCSYTA